MARTFKFSGMLLHRSRIYGSSVNQSYEIKHASISPFQLYET